jgi:hypothetical protein
MPADFAIANFKLFNGNVIVSNLPLDEETGTVGAALTGPSGTWNSAGGKKGIAYSSRTYPMTEGAGDTFYDALVRGEGTFTIGQSVDWRGAVDGSYGAITGPCNQLRANTTNDEVRCYVEPDARGHVLWRGSESAWIEIEGFGRFSAAIDGTRTFYSNTNVPGIGAYLDGQLGNTLNYALDMNSNAVIQNFSSVGPGWVFPYQQESRKVMERMQSLSGLERAAIDQFVRGCIADGNWALLDEFYCFVLNGTDWLTGWKAHTATTQGSVTRTSNGAQCNNTASHLNTNVVPSAGPNFTLSNAEAGVFIQAAPDWGTGNVDFMGVETAAASRLRWRHRGTDTNDLRNSCNRSATINSSLLQADISGKLHSVRGDAGNQYTLQDGVVTGTQVGAPEALDDAAVHLFRTNMASPQVAAANSVISVFYSGAELDTVAFEGRVRTLLAQLNVFLVGGP